MDIIMLHQGAVNRVWQNPGRAVHSTNPDQLMRLHEAQSLTGGTVLPGFTLTLQDQFTEFNRQESG